jgi:hypothetical protein
VQLRRVAAQYWQGVFSGREAVECEGDRYPAAAFAHFEFELHHFETLLKNERLNRGGNLVQMRPYVVSDAFIFCTSLWMRASSVPVRGHALTLVGWLREAGPTEELARRHVACVLAMWQAGKGVWTNMRVGLLATLLQCMSESETRRGAVAAIKQLLDGQNRQLPNMQRLLPLLGETVPV